MISFKRKEANGIAKSRPRLDSMPLMGQGYLFKVTHTTTATPISIDIEKKKCENCNYETNNLQDLGIHIETHHKPGCTNVIKLSKQLKSSLIIMKINTTFFVACVIKYLWTKPH